MPARGRTLVARALRIGSPCSVLLAVMVVASGALARAQPGASRVDPRAFQDLRWRNVGPARGGRVTAVTGVRSRPCTFYMGATGGGVWKTEDCGIAWRPVTDGQIATGSIGAIDVAESDPETVYVGTGSAAIRSNVIIGRGVYKSRDGGGHWELLGLRDAGQVGSVVVHPRNPDVVWVAALGSPYGPNDERGVFKTTDGGRTWRKVLFVNRETGARVLAINRADPDEIYAGMYRAFRKGWNIVSGGPASEGGIYKSTDGGDTWSKLSVGLPRDLIGRIDLDVARSRPRVVYAMIEAPGDEGGLYRSDDAGAAWKLVNSDTRLRTRPFYFHYVDVNPTNEDEVWVSELRLWKSTDAGRTITRVATPHADNHGIWFNPDNPRIAIECNDGGATVTQDGGRTWSSILNQPTAEMYMVSVDDQVPYRLYGPQQDNSTVIVPSLPPVSWELDRPEQVWGHGPGCETGQIVPRGDGQIVYGACKGEFGLYSVRTGQEQHYWVYPQNRYGHSPHDIRFRFPRQTVVFISPHDPRVLYSASHVVHRTTDEGVHWESISPDLTANEPDKQIVPGTPITRDITGEEVYSSIYAFTESRLEAGALWAGANDGPVHVSRDAGRTWKNVTPPGLPAGGRVQTIEDSPHRRGSAYIAAHRYLREHDLRPYVYATDDYGETWRSLTDGTNGIPADHPARVVREDPSIAGLLYAGTEFGAFVSFDNGTSWQSLQQNLPVTPVTDIRVHRGDLVISTMGRSFWIMDDISPLRQIATAMRTGTTSSRPFGALGVTRAGDGFDPERAHLFQPRDAYRLRYVPVRSTPEWPEYPPPGVNIDYILPGGAQDTSLEIRDSGGAIVRTFVSGAPRGPVTVDAMRKERARTGMTALPSRQGMNRFVWDMRYAGPSSPATETDPASGPLAPPGRYEVRLTTGAVVATRWFELLLDPRVEADGLTREDVVRQTAFMLRVRDAITEVQKLADRLEHALDLASDGVPRHPSKRPAGAPRERSLGALLDRLVTADGPYPQPMLIDQLSNIAKMLGAADQRVGADAVGRFDDLMREWEDIRRQAVGLLDTH